MRRKSWNVNASSFARNTHNPIRAIVENLKLEPNPDKPLIALSIGDPTIFGNLLPPKEVIESLVESVKSVKYNGYAPSTGYLEARQAVAAYSSSPTVTVKPEDVILCSGCSCSLDLCITVLANPGQNILVPNPGFSIYRTLAEGLGVHVKSYNLLPDQSWQIDLNHLESQIDGETVAIVINNPSNPCGSVYSAEHLRAVLEVAKRHYVPIIADEIYEHLVFKGEKFHALATLSKDVPILSCSGLTKRFLTPGWRMGWIVIHDRCNILGKEVHKGLQNLSQRIIGSNTLVQGALPYILKNTPQTFFDNTINTLQTSAQTVFSILSKINGLKPSMPQGAMYMMIGIDMSLFPEFSSSLEFVEAMVTEQSVFCLPGECFSYPGYMRIVLTVPEPQLLEACHRITLFCKDHSVDNLDSCSNNVSSNDTNSCSNIVSCSDIDSCSNIVSCSDIDSCSNIDSCSDIDLKSENVLDYLIVRNELPLSVAP